MDFITGILVGILFFGIIFLLFKNRLLNYRSKEQSVVLLEKIRHVSKMITIEGDFSELMHFEDVKAIFLKLVTSKKKAIVLANAKVFVGFDMEKIKFQSNANQKKLIIDYFPEPEVLSIEIDIKYYDVKGGFFNKFAAADLSELNKKVKQNIEEKIPESELLLSAKAKALETVQMIEEVVSTFGWKLEYTNSDLKNLKAPSREK